MSDLLDKFYGAEAATAIANSMGDITEGMTHNEIDETYGLLTELLPQKKSKRYSKQERGYDLVYHAHERPAGMTEDGHERHRLMVTAIVEKEDRVTIEDVANIWIRDVDPERFGYLMGPQDQIIYYSLKAGIPPWEVGRYASWPGMIGTSKMMIPVGLVNACNPQQAAQDAFEIGRFKDVAGQPGNYALESASAIAAAASEACRPHATVQSILDTALAFLGERARSEVKKELEWTKQTDDWREVRPKYAEKYRGQRASNALEVLSSGLAVFHMSNGDPEQAIIQAVNFGRDCDCRAYISGGLSAILRGIDALPQKWVETVEEQLPTDPYTVSRRLPLDAAKGLLNALKNNISRLEAQIRFAHTGL